MSKYFYIIRTDFKVFVNVMNEISVLYRLFLTFFKYIWLECVNNIYISIHLIVLILDCHSYDRRDCLLEN